MPTVSFARLERARADPDGKNKTSGERRPGACRLRESVVPRAFPATPLVRKLGLCTGFHDQNSKKHAFLLNPRAWTPFPPTGRQDWGKVSSQTVVGKLDQPPVPSAPSARPGRAAGGGGRAARGADLRAGRRPGKARKSPPPPPPPPPTRAAQRLPRPPPESAAQRLLCAGGRRLPRWPELAHAPNCSSYCELTACGTARAQQNRRKSRQLR
eukprot:gene19394-biopygen16044